MTGKCAKPKHVFPKGSRDCQCGSFEIGPDGKLIPKGKKK